MHIHQEQYDRMLETLREAAGGWFSNRLPRPNLLVRLSLDKVLQLLGIEVVLDNEGEESLK